MKKLLFAGALSAAMLGFTACSSDDPAFASGSGRINITSVDVDGAYAMSKDSRATHDAGITADDLKFRLINQNDGSVVTEDAELSYFASNDVKVGSYTLEAYYGSLEQEGHGKPFYYDAQTVKVTENNTTSVSLNAALSNSLLNVTFTDGFKKYFSTYSVEVYSENNNAVAFEEGNTEHFYVRPGTVKFYVTVTKPNNPTEITLNPLTFTAKAKTMHNVTFDVAGGANDAVLSINFDETLDAPETVEVELGDELFNTSGPEAEAEGFASGDNLEFIEGLPATTGDLKLTLTARAGLGKVIMKTTCPTLVAAGWPAGEFDLMKATPAEQAQLKALGLDCRGLWRNPGKMAVIDLTDVISHIGYDAATAVNTLSFSVEDVYTRVCEPVVLNVAISPIVMSLSNGFIEEGFDKMTLFLDFNGPSDIENYVDVQCQNSYGSYDSCPYTVVAPSRAATTSYELLVTVPVRANYNMRAVTKSATATSETEVVRPTLMLYDIAVTNAFATNAYVTVTSREDASAEVAGATIQISTDGKNFTAPAQSYEGSNVYKITGLSANTGYTVKALVGEDPTVKTTFTTEAALQLANAGMEEWCEPTKFSNSSLWVPGATAESTIWETNNRLTTSQSDPRAYCCTSGTKPTTDCASGSKAALIRTVGWGSGNTAAGGSSIVKHVSAGELYLGSWAGIDLPNNYGMSFVSRPASLSFKCKYSPKNSNDRGYAEITVKDAAGNVIATGTMDIEASSSYTEKTISLSYNASSAKAASLVVIFRSTNAGDTYLNKSNLSLGSISRSAEHVGSQLYIDDITLNY